MKDKLSELGEEKSLEKERNSSWSKAPTSCVKDGGSSTMARAWMAANGMDSLVFIDDCWKLTDVKTLCSHSSTFSFNQLFLRGTAINHLPPSLPLHLFPHTPTIYMSSLITMMNLPFGLPLFLLYINCSSSVLPVALNSWPHVLRFMDLFHFYSS